MLKILLLVDEKKKKIVMIKRKKENKNSYENEFTYKQYARMHHLFVFCIYFYLTLGFLT